MPYVAPMPNPDLVTGPDWTTALGAIALGLTKGVGEGAEIIQRDRAQKMQAQRDAVEQAYRDRQADLAERHWSADQAYRGEQIHLAKTEKEGAAWVEKLGGDLTGIDENVSPEVADAARRALPAWRKEKALQEYHSSLVDTKNRAIDEKERFGKEKHETELQKALINAYWHIHKNDPKAANQWAQQHGLSIPSPYDSQLVDAESFDPNQEPWAGNPDYWLNPETNEVEPRSVIQSKIANPNLQSVPPQNVSPKPKLKQYLFDKNKKVIGWLDTEGGQHPITNVQTPAATQPPGNDYFKEVYGDLMGEYSGGTPAKDPNEAYKKLISAGMAH